MPRRGSGLTSPVPRHSLGSSTATLQVSPVRRSGGSRYVGASRDGGVDESAEFVHYTVHIPPTPDRVASVASEAPGESAAVTEEEVHRPQRSYISGTIFTGGLNCATRGHVLNLSGDGARPAAAASGNMSCKMRGCDMPAFLNGGRPPCDCGFMICKECYTECIAAAGNCPGCKEAFSSSGRDTDSDSVTSDDDEAVSSSEERDQLPLTSMARKFSVVHSMKIPGGGNGNGNGKPAEFDHARWLFETKGTYGYGNALWPKDGHAHGSGAGATNGFVGIDEPPNFGARCRRPLTRKTSVSQAILSPYR
ncbi:hypothetical protein E2562_004007 [Oryza meyeriana var. granulata]|uniref:RING-type domain-containing protein n=1 Tax=Oryza meyeriana var. granulata TaxID=110450 RepID=A0A6G1BJ64_9ORYZ|nr:hypothetical protein E2562_004007 [Oryza meyeriana var. granulata]